MFRTVPLFIINSFSLYTQQRYMSYRFADSLRACEQAKLNICKSVVLLFAVYRCEIWSLKLKEEHRLGVSYIGS